MVDWRSAHGVERRCDFKRHFCEVSDGVGRGEASKHVSSPELFLMRGGVGLGRGRVALSPPSGELVARER